MRQDGHATKEKWEVIWGSKMNFRECWEISVEATERGTPRYALHLYWSGPEFAYFAISECILTKTAKNTWYVWSMKLASRRVGASCYSASNNNRAMIHPVTPTGRHCIGLFHVDEFICLPNKSVRCMLFLAEELKLCDPSPELSTSVLKGTTHFLAHLKHLRWKLFLC